MIRLSAGTARVLGFSNILMETPPTCAYLMLGTQCEGGCRFCAQSRDARESEYLSRITWKHEKTDEEVCGAIAEAYRSGVIQRACFQVVKREGSFDETLEAVRMLSGSCDIPICVSINGITTEEAGELLGAGVEHLAVSFDAATPDLFREIKGREWDEEWEFYSTMAARFPGRIVVHLIVGLGETEEEIFHALVRFQDMGSPVSLFAFTPIPGTPLAGRKPPDLSSYRRMQAVYYLIRTVSGSCIACRKGKRGTPVHVLKNLFTFREGRVVFRKSSRKYLLDTLPGEVFRTWGCSGCNRPLYNERPGQVPYNYPRGLTEEERVAAVESVFSCLGAGK